ncbi:MAG: cysteine dioxygenase [Planctomycetota bacterium]|jgi:cysteine dioxygenase
MVLKLRDRILGRPGAGARLLTRDEMLALARDVGLETVDLGDHRLFRKECYARNTVLVNEHVELAVICWLPGQSSAVHDHGRSNCLYLIVEGDMFEECFRLGSNGKPEPTVENNFTRGDITIASGDQIHRINNRTDSELVTIHIYSPPLGDTMRLYTPIPRSS